MFLFVFVTLLFTNPIPSGEKRCCSLRCVSNVLSCINRRNKTSSMKTRTINVEPLQEIYAFPLEPISHQLTLPRTPVMQSMVFNPSELQPTHLQSISKDVSSIEVPSCLSITFKIPDQNSMIKIPNMMRHQQNSNYLRLKEKLLHIHSVRDLPSLRNREDYSKKMMLLILNGRYTLYDAVSALDMEAKKALLQSDCLCFESMNYPDTINVIRPGFLHFIRTLNAFSVNCEDQSGNTSHVDAIVYVDHQSHQQSMMVLDELISVLAFIETHCDENEASITFRGLQFTEKDLWTLGCGIKLMNYSEGIIVDHENPITWCGQRGFGWTQDMQMKMKMFQPDCFKFEITTIHKPGGRDFHFVDRTSFYKMIGDMYLRRMSAQIIRDVACVPASEHISIV